MLTSLALIFLSGLILADILKKLRLPRLLGMIVGGILLGPYVLNVLDGTILGISADLRKIALIIILIRAGLALDVKELKKVGRPAILMCFIPASFEILGIVLIGPKILGVTVAEAAVIGAVTAAVSPAVIVPSMIKLIDEKYGTSKSIPQLIMAGASVDDVFVIVLFTSCTALVQGGDMSIGNFVSVPISIISGIILGMAVGFLLAKIFRNIHMRDSMKVLIILSISFLLLALEEALKNILPLSGLLSIMTMGISLLKNYKTLAHRLSQKFNKLWVGAEIILFVLVGATVDPKYIAMSGAAAVIVILGGLIFRAIGVVFSLIGTDLNLKERIFCVFAYSPKATVQAAIGGIPLAMGLACGNMVLTVAVLAILITAPLGSLAIDLSYKKLLKKEENNEAAA